MLPTWCIIICIVCSVLATFFSAITLISAHNSEDVVKNLSWSTGDSGDNHIYVGVYEFGFEFSSSSSSSFNTQKYDADGCNADVCDTCSTDMGAVIAFAVFFFVASLPSLYTNFMRWKGGVALHRTIGIVSSIVCVVCGFISLVTFAGGCQKSSEDYFSSSYNWTYGGAFGLLATALLLKVIDAVLNILIANP